jgi:alanine racemase
MNSSSSFIEIPGRERALSRSRVVVDLDALSFNLTRIRSRLSDRTDILPIIKADAYGHGMVSIARHLSKCHISSFGVMGFEEGVRLREAGITGKIVVLGGLLPDEISDCVRNDLTPVIHHFDQLDVLLDSVPDSPVGVHLKWDTGMGRLGFLPEDLSRLVDRLSRTDRVRVEGLLTHFSDGEDDLRTGAQVHDFETVVRELACRGILRDEVVIHMANSSALLSGRTGIGSESFGELWNGSVRFWVRPGLVLYGIPPSPEQPSEWKPVMKVEARLISIKTLPANSRISYGGTRILDRATRVGVLGLGYADGLPRELSDWGWAVREGNRFPFLGRVCMDMVVVDLTEAESTIGLGDWVTVMGDRGYGAMTAWDVAEKIRTIPYEIVCRLGNRSPHVYVGGTDSPEEGNG